jgi:hypothetical protein
MTKQQTIELLQQQLPGFYSVEQMIKIISEIEDTPSISINDELIESIVDEIACVDLDLISDYSLSISYREVELDSVSIDRRLVEEAVRQALKKQ